MTARCEVLVLGGGVAGAACALLCRRRGLAVTLVEPGRPRLSGPFETVVGSATGMLHRIGLADAVLAAAAPDPMRHGACWGSDDFAWRHAEQPGLLLRRGAFDAGLRRAAVAAGVRLVPTPPADLPSTVVRCDARGRAAHAGRTPAASAARLLAVTLGGRPHADDVGTATVEATPDGWIWTHAPDAAHAGAAVFVDGDEARAVGLTALVARQLAAARGPARRLQDAVVRHANDATPRLATAEPDVLRLGDAAGTIDPLASQGVEKALAAAEHAAAVVAATVAEPTWRARLFAAHARWEAGLWHAHGATAAAWYAREGRFRGRPFWSARQQPVPPAPPAAPDGTLVVSTEVEPTVALVRQGADYVARPGFVHRGRGDEATHVGYVPIAAVLALFQAPSPIAAAVARGGADPRLFVLPPRAVHAACEELWRRGWLIPAASATGSR